MNHSEFETEKMHCLELLRLLDACNPHLIALGYPPFDSSYEESEPDETNCGDCDSCSDCPSCGKEEILAAVQSELEVLREQERQLENSEMIAAIRNAKFSADDMLALVQAVKKGGTDLSALIPLAINATTTPTPFSER